MKIMRFLSENNDVLTFISENNDVLTFTLISTHATSIKDLSEHLIIVELSNGIADYTGSHERFCQRRVIPI
jgi:hypothetical protein